MSCPFSPWDVCWWLGSGEDGWTGDLSPTGKSSSTEFGQQSGVGVGGLRWANALALEEGLLAREEVGGLEDRLPLRARFLGGATDEEEGVVCVDVGNGMTLISLWIVDFLLETWGKGTATKKPSWRDESTCITFSGLQAETWARERVQVGRDLQDRERVRRGGLRWAAVIACKHKERVDCQWREEQPHASSHAPPPYRSLSLLSLIKKKYFEYGESNPELPRSTERR